MKKVTIVMTVLAILGISLSTQIARRIPRPKILTLAIAGHARPLLFSDFQLRIWGFPWKEDISEEEIIKQKAEDIVKEPRRFSLVGGQDYETV
jgi:hypothetical protein